MKILIITQYFYPENFRINDLALGLKEKGHQVSVLTGIPNYPKGSFFDNYAFWKNNDEVWNGMKIYRAKILPRGKGGIKLILNYLSFAFFCSIKALFIKEKFDKIFVYQPSPVTVGIPAIIASKKMKIPYYFWVQDLWPASLSAGGGINNPYIHQFFNKLTQYIYKKAKVILIQSNGFISYINKQGNFLDKITYFPNSAENFYKALNPEANYLNKMPEGFKLLYAGNLGEAQGISTFIDAAKIIQDKGIDIKWIFLGDGRQKDHYVSEIKRKNLQKNFFFLGSFPVETMPSFFCCADALIVSLKNENIFSLTVPSKIPSYLASGKPILGALDGEGAKVISDSKAGYVSMPENPELFAKIVIDFYNLTNTEKKEMAENAIKYFKKEFDRDMLIDRLVTIFEN